MCSQGPGLGRIPIGWLPSSVCLGHCIKSEAWCGDSVLHFPSWHLRRPASCAAFGQAHNLFEPQCASSRTLELRL